MKHSIRKSIAVAALVAASAIALPTAASAETIYPPALACSATPTALAPGGTTTFSCDDETFAPEEIVSITVEGATSSDIGFAKFATTSTGSALSTGTGGLAGLPITFPSSASGVYVITAVSESSSGGSASVTVTPATTGGGGSLPATGIDSNSLLGLWVGGGALILVGGTLAVATTVRRNRKQSAGI